MIIGKACFSKHSQWPPKNFRLSPGLRVYAAFILPWMSETFIFISFCSFIYYTMIGT